MTASGTPSSQTPPEPTHGGVQAPRPGWWLRQDRVLLVAFATCGVLFAFQLGVTLAHPPWIDPVTDWLRAALAWPQLLVVILFAVWGTRQHDPRAAASWLLSLAMLAYGVAITMWALYDQVLYPQGVPYPNLSDVFFLLQYPCLLVAFLLLPSLLPWTWRVQVVLDGVLLLGAAMALSWYFVLAPLYARSGLSPLARVVSLAYPLGDLLVLGGVTRLLVRGRQLPTGYVPLTFFGVAIACLVIADTLVARSVLPPPHLFRTGHWPDLFWFACYLLIPLAMLVALRLMQPAAFVRRMAAMRSLTDREVQFHDLLVSLRELVPALAALLASLLLGVKAVLLVPTAGGQGAIVPILVGTILLLLALVRQTLTYMERERLRREQAAAQVAILALAEANRRMEAFLGIASHELKTPLTSLQGNVELLARRLSAAQRQGAGASTPSGHVGILDTALAILERCDQSLRRIARLVNDMLDDARIQKGRLCLQLEPGDLAVVVQAAVDDQRLLASERTIDLELSAGRPMLVRLDPDRIGQVVTNYLSNALKYSSTEQPVIVRVQVEGGQARVTVRDEGVGVPLAAQAHIWERFYRAEGVSVQSGSGVGLGIGLHICQAIIAAHGGQVGVDSEVGHGSTFWFTLPLVPPLRNLTISASDDSGHATTADTP